MLRAFIQRKVKHISGAEYSTLATIDFEEPYLEQVLRSGGLAESAYDIASVIAVEVFEKSQEA